MRLNLAFSIVTGDMARSLADYIDTRYFTQRKSFDEYYCDVKYLGLDIDLDDLLILFESVNVLIQDGCIHITDN